MPRKRDPDDAPELTEEPLAQGDVFMTAASLSPSASRKQLVTLRLDPAVLEKLRAMGPGWQMGDQSRAEASCRTTGKEDRCMNASPY